MVEVLRRSRPTTLVLEILEFAVKKEISVHIFSAQTQFEAQRIRDFKAPFPIAFFIMLF